MKELRNKIDNIDRSLIELLEERFEVARAIGRYKEERNLPMYDPVREKQKLDTLGNQVSADKRAYMEKILAKVMEQCRTFEEDNHVPKYGLLGRKLGHSFSPQIHKALGGYEFGLFEKEPEEIEEYMTCGGFKGLCVTIPYKRQVMEYCDEISEVAMAANSVNTIVRRDDGSLYGDNTDYFGFRYMVESEGFAIEGRKCIVLGAGGVSGTVKKALLDMGAASVTLISRSGEDNYENISRHFDAQIVVNATPVGMYPDGGISPVDINLFSNCEGAIDLIYNPLRTKLVLDAQKVGIKACSGMKMLVAQAARGCKLFTGKDTSSEEIDFLTGRLEREQANIVLIGMPGAGKTSIGKALAEIIGEEAEVAKSEKVGREFVDVDCLIEVETGRAPADIIEQDGEAFFRDIETEILRKALKSTGKVIACGGGIVEREENYHILRENSIVIYIKRNIEELPVSGRPVSKARGIEAIFESRAPKYEAWSDFSVDNIGVEATAKAIAGIKAFRGEIEGEQK